jgi:DNA (cytosine-5)-methyltransferase 1
MTSTKDIGMKVLNLYSGLGGNRKKWENVQVTAVEFDPRIAAVYKRLYPDDEVIVGDAHQYLLDHHHEFDFIWSSPPCQTHSKMMKATRHKKARYSDMSLYQEILFLQHFHVGSWVVENGKPYYEPLIKPTALGRHLFWSNFEITAFDTPQPPNFINLANNEGKKILMDWLDIHYEENIYYGNNHCPAQILRNCVHPLVGEHILNCAIKSPGPGETSKQLQLLEAA